MIGADAFLGLGRLGCCISHRVSWARTDSSAAFGLSQTILHIAQTVGNAGWSCSTWHETLVGRCHILNTGIVSIKPPNILMSPKPHHRSRIPYPLSRSSHSLFRHARVSSLMPLHKASYSPTPTVTVIKSADPTPHSTREIPRPSRTHYRRRRRQHVIPRAQTHKQRKRHQPHTDPEVARDLRETRLTYPVRR